MSIQIACVMCGKKRLFGLGYMKWRRFLFKAEGHKAVYERAKYYCPSCTQKIEQWRHSYAEKIISIVKSQTGEERKQKIREIGVELSDLGGIDLMVMVATDAGERLPRPSFQNPDDYTIDELNMHWNGIGGWQW